MATIDIEGGEVLADFDPFDDGDPIATSSGLIALDSASQRLFFIGRNSVWSIYTVDLADGSGTPQPIDNSMIQTNGYAGIEVVPGPDLSLSKDDGGISAVPGDTISYSLTAGNASGAGTSNVTELVETVPTNTQFNAGASTAGWVCTPDANAGSTCTLALPDLASGDSNVSTFAVDVLPSVAAGTVQISNSATLQAFNALAGVMASDVTPLASAAALSLDKTDGDVGSVPSGTVIYTLTIANTGNQDTANLVLGETVPANSTFNAGSSTAGWTCLPDGSAGSACSITLGTLAGGSNSPVAFAVDVDNPVAVGVTELQNTATANADNAAAVNDADNTPVTAAPVVAVSITDQGITAIPGDVVVYQIDYANNGNQDAESANLALFVPAQTTFVPGSSSAGWICGPGPGVVLCDYDLGTVAGGGAGGSVNFAVVIDDPVMAGTTAIDIAVSLGLLNGLPDDANDSTPLTAEPALVLYKSDGDISSAPGQRISYALLAVNEGNMDAAGTVLTETVPANTRFDAGNSSPDWVCTPGIDAGSSCAVDLGTLDGSSFELRLFAVNINNPVPTGTSMISNSASLDADNATIANGSDTTPLDVRLDLAVTKSDGGVTAYAGQPLSYALGFENAGTQVASGVSLAESVPTHTTFNSALSSSGWTCPDQAPAGTVCTLDVGQLAVGASGTATFVVNVDDPVPNGVDTLSNSVQISDDGASGADVSPSDNSASVDTPVINPMLDLSITKTGVLDEMAGVVDYEINVANIGNLDDAGASLRDALADPVFDSASAAWSCVAAGGASCPPLGVGPINVMVDLPVGSALSVLISVPLLAVPIPEQILNVAEITPSIAGSDINPGNNSAISSIISCLFCNGFDPEIP